MRTAANMSSSRARSSPTARGAPTLAGLKARELAGPAAQRDQPAIGMSPATFQRVFAEVRSLLQLDDQRLTLYSWRRGGASADFRSHGSMETTLLRGRWASVRTARLYVQDAVAEATTLALLPAQRAACLQLASRAARVG